MIVEIIKGLKYFYAMVIVVFVAFSVAQINLFRARPSVSGAHSWVYTCVHEYTCCLVRAVEKHSSHGLSKLGMLDCGNEGVEIVGRA